ncbi:hypothetical protein AB0I02_40375 [Streptomyces phaeochromogenes]
MDMEKSGPDPRDGTVAGSGEATVLAEPVWQLMLVCVGCGGVGGWLLTLLADLWLSLPWVPMKGPARLLTSVPEPWLTVGAVVVGLALGVLVGFIAVYESLTARISDSGVVLTIRDSDQEFTHDEIALACRDGKQLVLVAPDGGELSRERCGLPWRRLAEAFTAHGYEWGAPRGS